MNSKKIICGALAATLTLGVAFSGCSLKSVLNEADMKQLIATVDISKSGNLGNEGLEGYATAISATEITKRDLYASFVNVGYQYVQSDYSYEDTFNLLVDSLTSNAVVSQYATLYVLKQKDEAEPTVNVLEEYNAKSTLAEKYVYLLGGEKSEDVKLAKYSLYSTLNSALDNIEKSIIDGEDEATGTDSRTTPGNVDTVTEDYYPKKQDDENATEPDYYVYTGYEGYLLENSGAYKDDEALEGTTVNTRIQAYSTFISRLKKNYLISSDDKTTTDVLSISYIQDEYVSYLQQVIINKYYDMFVEEQEAVIKETDDGGKYTFLEREYEILLEQQTATYSNVSDFESALGSMSSTSFILYSPDTTSSTEGGNGTYGYVYNILLPYDAKQSATLSSYSKQLSDGIIDDNEYYIKRNGLLKNIRTTDQRSAWFNGTTDYSFDATETSISYYNGGNEARKYLFFENNLVKTEKYEKLEKYAGLYTYNGTVTENDDGTYNLTPVKLGIDEMLAEFSSYVNFVLNGGTVQTDYVNYTVNGNYYSTEQYYKTDEETGELTKDIDYSLFVYATGKVNFTADKKNMFVKDGEQYLATSAVNELQHAYTTDTSVLSQYIGYSVSAYDTSYIKEFEYAAHEAVKQGAGAFSVCAGDYGWHLIYVTDTFAPAGGEAYTGISWTADRVEQEGTFENMFYEWLKDSMLSDVTTSKRSTLIEAFGGSTTVKVYKEAFKDLLELGS